MYNTHFLDLEITDINKTAMSSYSPTIDKLTVDCKIKVLEEQKGKQTSILLAFFKWMVAIILFFAVLASLVIGKMSILSIGMKLKRPIYEGPPTTSTPFRQIRTNWSTPQKERREAYPEPLKLREDTTQSQTNRTHIDNLAIGGNLTDATNESEVESDVAYAMLILFMVIPNCISLLRSFVRAVFSSTQVWPRKRALIAVSSFQIIYFTQHLLLVLNF